MLNKIIDYAEKKTGYDMNYARKLHKLSRGALLRFSVMPFVGSGISKHADARAVARICSTLHDDCGECLKIAVHRCLEEGASRELLVKLVRRETLEGDLGLVQQLCRAALDARPEVAELSRRVEEKLGGKVLADVAVNLAVGRTYPTLKRALGAATTECLMPSSLLS